MQARLWQAWFYFTIQYHLAIHEMKARHIEMQWALGVYTSVEERDIWGEIYNIQKNTYDIAIYTLKNDTLR